MWFNENFFYLYYYLLCLLSRVCFRILVFLWFYYKHYHYESGKQNLIFLYTSVSEGWEIVLSFQRITAKRKENLFSRTHQQFNALLMIHALERFLVMSLNIISKVSMYLHSWRKVIHETTESSRLSSVQWLLVNNHPITFDVWMFSLFHICLCRQLTQPEHSLDSDLQGRRKMRKLEHAEDFTSIPRLISLTQFETKMPLKWWDSEIYLHALLGKQYLQTFLNNKNCRILIPALYFLVHLYLQSNMLPY